MKKYILCLCVISFLAANTACGPKAPPNLSPVGQSQYTADKYITALSDFQDGVEVGYRSGWLSRNNTFIVVEALSTAFVTIHETPNGAKATALKAIADVSDKLRVTPEFSKWVPYLDSVKSVVEGL